MTLEELKKSNHIIFECISGSKAYGLDTPKSDTDIRGVFILPKEQFYGLDYVSQISNETNDIVYYELRKFMELCAKNNPNIIEMLNVPEHCILNKNPLFDKIKVADFLSKKCEASFANYAYSQIKKARGLEKKIVNPMEKERKTILDFCFVLNEARSIPLNTYLTEKELKQENCGLSKIPHMKDCFNLFHCDNVNYAGIMKSNESNEVTVSKIEKETTTDKMLFFNKDAYSSYCKKYSEYWDWVKKRNQERYSSTLAHGKNYDSKNMMHTFRLLHMAKEIAINGNIMVERSDRAYLLAIKNGEFEYNELVQRAEEIKRELAELYLKSDLQESPDLDKINNLLVEIRNNFYRERSNDKKQISV